MNAIDASTRLVALLGSPVSHSLSPAMHNAAFASAGLNVRYVAIDVPSRAVGEAIRALDVLGFLGANVTIPLKQDVARHVDSLSPVAHATGAVNTLVLRRGDGQPAKIEGDNTDVEGFLAALRPYRSQVHGHGALILGAGGAARAVVYALAREMAPDSITVAARSRTAVLSLMNHFEQLQIAVDAVPFEQAADVAANCALVVNATPIGMYPAVDVSPLPSGVIGSGQVVYDLVYNPTNTRLLVDARNHGAMAIDGLEMLVAQAAASFKLWTGVTMPDGPARQALATALALRSAGGGGS